MTGLKAARRRELFLRALAEGAALEAAAAAADYSLAYARRIWRESMAEAAPTDAATEVATEVADTVPPQAVAGREEVLSFLTDLLRATAAGGEAGVKERLKAAELLGKGNGAFQPQAADNHLHIEIEVVE